MIFHVMISASLLEGATHHFCFFFCIFQADRSASKLLSLVVFWVYSDCCLHPFSHCQKMARVKITILEMWRFPKTGVPQIIDFQRIFHSKPSSDPHWNPRSMSFWPKKMAQKVRAGGRVGLGAVAEVSGHFLRKWTGWMAMDSIRIQRLSMA